MEPKPAEDCPESQNPAGSQCHPHWLGSPCRAAAGHSQCWSQHHILEQSLVLPLHTDQLSRRDFCSIRDELTTENPFALNQRLRPHSWSGHPRASTASMPQPASCWECSGALVVMRICNKTLAVHHSSTTFKPILIPLAPKAPIKTEPLGELHQEAANKKEKR